MPAPEPAPAPPPDPAPPPAAPRPDRPPVAGHWLPPEAAARGVSAGAVAFTVLLFAAVAGLAVYLLFFLPRPPEGPHLEVVPVQNYTRLPPAAGAVADLKQLARRLGAERLADAATTETAALDAQWLRNRLAAVRAGLARPGSGETLAPDRPFVFAVSALGGLAADDSPCLLTRAAEGDGRTGWVPLAELLDALAECPCERKLLVLDLARPAHALPGDGLPADGEVSAAVHRLLDDRANAGRLPFFVLTSCGPGQVSHPVPHRGMTAFGLYLDTGLAGAADDPMHNLGPNLGDGNVTVTELATYVRGRVRRWAATARDRPQEPTLYPAVGGPADFVLLYNLDPEQPWRTPPVNEAEPPPPAYEAAGTAPLWAKATPIDSPAKGRAAAALVWAEEWFAATGQPDRDAVRIAESWLTRVTAGPSAAPPDPTVAAAAKEIEKAFDTFKEPPRTADVLFDLRECRDAATRAAGKAVGSGAGPAVANAVLDGLLTRVPDSHTLLLADEMVLRAVGTKPPPFDALAAVAEAFRITPFDTAEGRTLTAERLRAAAAVARLDPRSDRLNADLAVADRRFADAVELRHNGRAAVREARELYRKVTDAVRAEREARDGATAVARSAERLLPVLAATARPAAAAGPLADGWVEAATAAVAGKPTTWADDVRARFDPTAVKARLVATREARPEALPDYRAALATPLIPAAERAGVWAAYHLHLRTLHLKALAADADGPPADGPTVRPVPDLGPACARWQAVADRLKTIGSRDGWVVPVGRRPEPPGEK